jgi:transmembrane sensor
MERRGRSKFSRQIYEEACEWFIECRAGDLDGAARAELDRWLRKSPEHLSAYLEIAAIWNEGPSLDPAEQFDADRLIVEAGMDCDNIVALPSVPKKDPALQMAAPPAQSDPVAVATAQCDPVAAAPDSALNRNGLASDLHPGIRRWRRARTLAASFAAIGLVVVGILQVDSLRGATYATAIGEQRSMELEDGSTVALNSRSKIRVRYSAGQRNVDLVEGQALFHVAKDAARPFIVRSGATSVRAVGTEFDVYQRHDGTVVTVVEGRVAVLIDHPVDVPESFSPPESIPAAGGPPVPPNLPFPDKESASIGNIFVSAGEQLTVTPKQVQRATHPNIAGATAWTERQLVFESASLSEVAEEFNRYNERQLIIQDHALETFHISGVFSSTDPASLIRFLRARPGLRVVETASEFRIEKNIP